MDVKARLVVLDRAGRELRLNYCLLLGHCSRSPKVRGRFDAEIAIFRKIRDYSVNQASLALQKTRNSGFTPSPLLSYLICFERECPAQSFRERCFF